MLNKFTMNFYLCSHDFIFLGQCLVEAIYNLDILCMTDKSLIPKLIEIIRRLYTRVKSDVNRWKRVLIPVVQFLLNHGECSSMQLIFKSPWKVNSPIFVSFLATNIEPWVETWQWRNFSLTATTSSNCWHPTHAKCMESPENAFHGKKIWSVLETNSCYETRV